MTQIKFDSFWLGMFYLPSQIKRFLADFKICNSKILQNAVETLGAQLTKISRYSYLVDSYIALRCFGGSITQQRQQPSFFLSYSKWQFLILLKESLHRDYGRMF